MIRRLDSSPSEIRTRKARVELRKRLSDLVDYMDTLDQQVWDDLELSTIYNGSLDTINKLKYNSAEWEAKNEKNNQSI